MPAELVLGDTMLSREQLAEFCFTARVGVAHVDPFEPEEGRSSVLADRQNIGHAQGASSRQLCKSVGFGLKHLQTRRIAMFDEHRTTRALESGT